MIVLNYHSRINPDVRVIAQMSKDAKEQVEVVRGYLHVPDHGGIYNRPTEDIPQEPVGVILPSYPSGAAAVMSMIVRRTGQWPVVFEFDRLGQYVGVSTPDVEEIDTFDFTVHRVGIAARAEIESAKSGSAADEVPAVTYPAGVETVKERRTLRFSSTNGRINYTVILHPGIGYKEVTSEIGVAYGKASRAGDTIIIQPTANPEVVIIASKFAGDCEVIRGNARVLVTRPMQSSKYFTVLVVGEGHIIRFYGYDRRSRYYYAVSGGRLVEPDPEELLAARTAYFRAKVDMAIASSERFRRFKHSGDDGIDIVIELKDDKWQVTRNGDVTATLSGDQVRPYMESIDHILNWSMS